MWSISLMELLKGVIVWIAAAAATTATTAVAADDDGGGNDYYDDLKDYDASDDNTLNSLVPYTLLVFLNFSIKLFWNK